jgi:hypothetical protein
MHKQNNKSGNKKQETTNETRDRRGQNESMNLTVQKTSTKQEALMTYRGNELRSPFANQQRSSRPPGTSRGTRKPTRWSYRPMTATRPARLNPRPWLVTGQREVQLHQTRPAPASANSRPTRRTGAHFRNRPSGFADKVQEKCQSTVKLVRSLKYETTK